MPVQLDPATYRGTYHVRTRAKTSQATFSAVYLQNLYLQFAGAKVFPFTAANTWTSAVDVGYLPVPSSPPGGLQDQTLARAHHFVNFHHPVAASSDFLN